MKKNIFTALLSVISCYLFAQSGEITTTGIVYPQYTTANRPTSPITPGTTIFNTTLNTHQYYNGSAWVSISNATGNSPWTLTGNSVHNNSGSGVGINSPKPAADLEILGGGGLLINRPYTVNSSTPAPAISIPYNGNLANIMASVGRILDPGGNGNYLTNIDQHGFVRLIPGGFTHGFRFTFESLQLEAGARIVLSTSSDLNDLSSKILEIDANSNYAIGKPFLINVNNIYIHFAVTAGSPSAAGFQLLYEQLTLDMSSASFYSEYLGSGLSFSPYYGSFSAGNQTTARAFGSVALGNNTTSNGDFAIAMGSNTKGIGNYSIAMGSFSTTHGDYSIAMGRSATASGEASISLGRSTVSEGDYSTALGRSTTASGLYSTAMGIETTASGESSIAMGDESIASGDFSTAIGYLILAEGNYATAMGRKTVAEGEYSTALGNETAASGIGSLATGSSTTASGESSTAMGRNTIASGKFSTSIGSSTTASGDYSIAIGRSNMAIGGASTAMGYSTTASSDYATAMGNSTNASGVASMAIGNNTTASGNSSTAMGRNTTASGDYSTAMGSRVSTNGKGGAFIIGDSYNGSTQLNAGVANRFYARFRNGYELYTSANNSNKATLLPNANAWSTTSDSTKKERFIPANHDEVLNSVSQMRIGTWNYKGNRENRHWGIMAQDFYKYFGKDKYGTIGNDTTIATADFDGVAFAAIKGLEERTRDLQVALRQAQSDREKLKMKNVDQQNTINELLAEIGRLKEDRTVFASEILLIKQQLGLNSPESRQTEE